jgi:hypothetical protein
MCLIAETCIERVVARLAIHFRIAVRGPDSGVVAVTGIDINLTARTSVERVVSLLPVELVIAIATDECVVPGRPR